MIGTRLFHTHKYTIFDLCFKEDGNALKEIQKSVWNGKTSGTFQRLYNMITLDCFKVDSDVPHIMVGLLKQFGFIRCDLSFTTSTAEGRYPIDARFPTKKTIFRMSKMILRACLDMSKQAAQTLMRAYFRTKHRLPSR